MALRECKKCGVVAIIEEDLHLFKKNSRCNYGRTNLCKKCHSATQQRVWQSQDEANKYKRKRDSHYKNLYGVSIEWYDTKLREQNNRCGICNTHTSKLSKVLCIDHDHKTGKPRGLLCRNCNSGIGLLNDSISVINNASEYLIKYKD